MILTWGDDRPTAGWLLSVLVSVLTSTQCTCKSETLFKEEAIWRPSRDVWRCLSWWLEWCSHRSREAGSHKRLEEERNGLSGLLDAKSNTGLLITCFWPRDADFRVLASRTGREHISVLLSHKVHDDLLQQCWRKLLRGCDFGWTLKLDPELRVHSPIFGTHVPSTILTLWDTLRTQPWKSKRLLRPPRVYLPKCC